MPTPCIRNSGFSDITKVSAFNESEYQTERKVLLIRYCTYTQTDGGHCKKTAEHPNNYDKKNERNFFNT